MGKENGELEKLSIEVEGVVCGSDRKRAYIKTGRDVENFLWSLAMKAGYTFRDHITYEITVKKKAE